MGFLIGLTFAAIVVWTMFDAAEKQLDRKKAERAKELLQQQQVPPAYLSESSKKDAGYMLFVCLFVGIGIFVLLGSILNEIIPLVPQR